MGDEGDKPDVDGEPVPDCSEGESSGDLRSKFPRAGGERSPEAALTRNAIRKRLFSTPSDGSKLGRFRLQRTLGAGGMGVVYEAVDERTNERVALKTLQKLDADRLYFLKHEFRALAGIVHPNVVARHELFAEEGVPFFTMQLVRGVGFLEYVCGDPSQESCNVERLRSSLRQLFEAVGALHRAGKLHLDIKPSNVMVTPDGRVVLLDFGLVREVGHSTIESVTAAPLAGTPAFMSPEQLTGGAVSEACDAYSVGVMLYRAATGQLPAHASNLHELIELKLGLDVESVADDLRDLPEDLRSLGTMLLEREPARRPTGVECLRRLGDVVAESPEPALEVPPFVGRTQELQALREAYDSSVRDGPLAVRVHGRSGIGKTALVRRFLQDLRQTEDTVVLSGRCYEHDHVPYRAVDPLVDSLSRYLRRLRDIDAVAVAPREIQALARLFPVLARVPSIASAPKLVHETDVQELQRRAFSALKELLARIADRHPLVLYVDDLHWADLDSIAILQDLLRPPEPPRLLLVVSYRSEEAATSPALEALLEPASVPRVDRFQEVELGPLSEPDARELAEELLGRQSVSVTEAIARESEGSPFFVGELARHARSAGVDGSQPDTRISLDEVVMARLAGLSDQASRLLQVVSVAGAPIEERLATAAAQLDTGSRAALAALCSDNLLRERSRSGDTDGRLFLVAYHDRIRESVVRSLEQSVLVDTHAQLARVMAEVEVPDASKLAFHYERAGEHERASEFAVIAGDVALEACACDQAANMYEIALRLGVPSSDLRKRVLIGLGDALAGTGDGPGAARAHSEALEYATGTEALDLRRRVADALLRSGRIRKGLEVLNSVLGEQGVKYPPTSAHAIASLLWGQIQLRVRGVQFEERRESEVEPSRLLLIDSYETVSVALALVDNVRAADFQTRALLLALRTGEPSRIAHGLLIEAGHRGSAGIKDLPRAHALVEVARAIVERSADPLLLGTLGMIEGVLEYFGGRFRRATELLAGAERLFREKTAGTWSELSLAYSFRIFALRYTDAFAELGRVVPEYVLDAERRGDRFAATSFRRYGNIALVARGDLAGARDNLARATWAPLPGGYHFQHYWEMLAEAEMELYQRRTRELIDTWRPRLQAFKSSLLSKISQMPRSEWGCIYGRLALAQVDAGHEVKRALRAAEKNAAAVEREGVGFAVVWGKLLRAGVEINRDEERAVPLLREIVSLADAEDLTLYAAVARYRLGNLVGGDDGRALVTQAEAWMRSEGVQDPDRIAGVIAPGFARTVQSK